jgi:hypothetical protein
MVVVIAGLSRLIDTTQHASAHRPMNSVMTHEHNAAAPDPHSPSPRFIPDHTGLTEGLGQRLAIVITTLDPSAAAISRWSETGHPVVLIGDRRSAAPNLRTANADWWPLDEQSAIDADLAAAIPTDHYARKNLGYVAALRRGADVIFETDDDNEPHPDNPGGWIPQSWTATDELHALGPHVNVYPNFLEPAVDADAPGTPRIWPRGFPLSDLGRESDPQRRTLPTACDVGVWQGLADLDPDVDAIHRIATRGATRFVHAAPAMLAPFNWCPFNSQATAWSRSAVDLAYLPSTVSMRWTDILRGYVAQRLLWERGARLGFVGPTVVQHRNAHDLVDDLAAEIEMYRHTPLAINTLASLDLRALPIDQHLRCAYQALAAVGVVDPSELEIVNTWIAACREVLHDSANTTSQGASWTKLAS